jgi:RES domain
MSPAGIPVFYAARDSETAFLETVAPDANRPIVSIGKFETTRDLCVLDLDEIQGIPSLFDESNRDLRSKLKFMRAFADDLAEPIQRDGREHIDYVPTQIVSEFFRVRFLPPAGMINGICFKSSKHVNGICACLFFENKDFSEECSRAALRLLEVESRAAF